MFRLLDSRASLLKRSLCVPFVFSADESGSDEDFMVEDDDDSDYGRSKKRGKKVIRRGRPDKKEKKSPKPRLKATGGRLKGQTLQLFIYLYIFFILFILIH